VRNTLAIEVRKVCSTIRRDHKALDTAPADADAKPSKSVDKAPNLIEAAVSELEAEKSRRSGKCIRQLSKRWVMHGAHLGPVAEILRDTNGIRLVLLHADRQGAQAAQ